MNRKRIFHKEGKGKIFYEGTDKETLIQYFKDDLTAFNKEKTAIADGKGILNSRITAFFFKHLKAMSIPSHFIRSLNMREHLVHQLDMLPLEVTVRNYAAGDIVKRLGLKYATQLPRPVLEFRYKSDDCKDPLVCEEHISAFGWATSHEMDEMVSLTYRVNDFLSGVFLGVDIRLADFKLEFGRLYDADMHGSRLILGDEITPDSCRLWDLSTGHMPGSDATILDKDCFRKDIGGSKSVSTLLESYQEVAKRLGVLPQKKPRKTNLRAKFVRNDKVIIHRFRGEVSPKS